MKVLPRRPIDIAREHEAPDWHPVLGRAAIKRWLNIAVVATSALSDVLMFVLAFVIAYRLRAQIDLFSTFAPPSRDTNEIILAVLLITLLITFNLSGLYSLRRGVSRIDQFYRISTAVSIGLVTVGRFVHSEATGVLRRRTAARDRLLIVGTGKTGRLVLETI